MDRFGAPGMPQRCHLDAGTQTSDENTKYLHAKAEMSVSTYPSIKPEDILEIHFPYPKESHLYILVGIKKKIEPIYNLQKGKTCTNKLSL